MIQRVHTSNSRKTHGSGVWKRMAPKPIALFRRQRTAAFFVDLDERQFSVISGLGESAGIESFSCSTISAGAVNWDSAAVVVINATNGSGVCVARDVRRLRPDLPVVIVTTESTEELAIEALRAGVNEYLRCPSAESIMRAISLLVSPQDEKDASYLPIVGDSPAILNIREYIPKIAAVDSNVLITGETGTGKELIARLIHQESRRANQPMVCLNCAAIPESLLESELFGHERGAFTGADTASPGQLESANGGTVFFDEIGEMSQSAQAKILRVLEERRVQRLGRRKSIGLDVRIIAATNRDLDSLALEDKFRKDLYFRLNVGRIHLPPLRERKADIPALLRHYLREFNQTFKASVTGIEEGLMESLLQYRWPGNVRELRNVLEAAFISQPMSKIAFNNLPEWFRSRLSYCRPHSLTECDRLLAALEEMDWNKSKAATKLRWSRMTLYRKMAKYHIAGPAK
jgi:DNA-binding NtrC family response regulator